MKNRWRLFGLLAVLLFILHVIARLAAVAAFHAEATVTNRFGPSFALALTSLPLVRLSLFNSVIVAAAIAAVIAFLPSRVSVVIVAGVPILLIAGMLGAATILDWRTNRGWRELAPRPITPAPRGTLAINIGPSSSIGDYLNKAVRSAAPVSLPQDADWFLVLHRREIEALRHDLPSSRSVVDRFVLQRLLLADALQTHAADEIEAAKRIADTLLHEPNIGAANLAIASARQRIGVARKLGMPEQAVGFDPHQQLIDSIYAQTQEMRALPSPWYARPYARLCIAESAYVAMQQARVIRNLRGLRFDQPKDEQPSPRVPWNPIGVFNGGRRLAWRANELVSLAAPTSK